MYHLCSWFVPEVNFGQGELAHRALKAFYPLTSKIDTPGQLAKHERQRCVLQRVAEAGTLSSGGQSQADPPLSASSEQHHFIATNWNNPVEIFTFIREHNGDPTVKVGVALHLRCSCDLLTAITRIYYRDLRIISSINCGN
jgi:hypothetical protein